MVFEISLLIAAGTIIFIVKKAESKIQELEVKKIILSEKLNKVKKSNNGNTKKLTYKDKIEKGKKYEEYIANYFKEQGYYIWEHGKEKGVKDKSIDLFIRKENKAYFVQCKNWENWKISHKEIKATRMDIREYLKTNKEFWELIKEKELKILYVTSKECLTKGAYKYIQENNDIIEYKVIPIIN